MCNHGRSKTRVFRELALALLVLAAVAAPALAEDVAQFATPNDEGTGYSINYDALEKAKDLTRAEKFQVARILRNGENHVAAPGIEDIAGLGGHCTIHKIMHVIPDEVDCTLTAKPGATVVLSEMGAFVLTNAICLLIDAEDDELTEPICDVLLEAVVETTIMPVLEQCADHKQSSELKFKFNLAKPSLHASAQCI